LADLRPVIHGFVDKGSHLMTDQLHAYRQIGKLYAGHDWVNHSEKEFARGDAHNNTAESFNAILERAKHGVFHYLSKKHLSRYLNEVGFRWNHRRPELKLTRKGKWKIVMKPLAVMDKIRSLLSNAFGRLLRRTRKGGIKDFSLQPLFGS
jgi:hypothetical protein